MDMNLKLTTDDVIVTHKRDRSAEHTHIGETLLIAQNPEHDLPALYNKCYVPYVHCIY